MPEPTSPPPTASEFLRDVRGAPGDVVMNPNPYSSTGVDPVRGALGMGAAGAGIGLAVGAIQQLLARRRGEQEGGARRILLPSAIGALSGGALGLLAAMQARKATLQPGGMTYGDLAASWEKTPASDRSHLLRSGLRKCAQAFDMEDVIDRGDGTMLGGMRDYMIDRGPGGMLVDAVKSSPNWFLRMGPVRDAAAAMGDASGRRDYKGMIGPGLSLLGNTGMAVANGLTLGLVGGGSAAGRQAIGGIYRGLGAGYGAHGAISGVRDAAAELGAGRPRAAMAGVGRAAASGTLAALAARSGKPYLFGGPVALSAAESMGHYTRPTAAGPGYQPGQYFDVPETSFPLIAHAATKHLAAQLGHFPSRAEFAAYYAQPNGLIRPEELDAVAQYIPVRPANPGAATTPGATAIVDKVRAFIANRMNDLKTVGSPINTLLQGLRQ